MSGWFLHEMAQLSHCVLKGCGFSTGVVIVFVRALVVLVVLCNLALGFSWTLG